MIANSSGVVEMVSLEQVLIEDARYRLTRGNPTEELIENIRRWGCFTPPICWNQGEGLIPVSGFKRLKALQKIHCLSGDDPSKKKIEVRVLSSGVDWLEMMACSAGEVLKDRPLNPFECARALTKGFEAGLSREEVIKTLLPVLGLQPYVNVLKQHLKLMETPDQLVQWLEPHNPPLKRALTFSRIKEGNVRVVMDVIEGLQPSLRGLEVLCQLIGECARRESLSWEDMLDKLLLRSILSDSDLSFSERNRRVKSRLWRCRYPNWAESQDRVDALLDALSLPERLSVAWDEQFEKEGFEMKLYVRTVEEMQEDLRSLLDPDNSKSLQVLLEAL
jgi:hypothetical protein